MIRCSNIFQLFIIITLLFSCQEAELPTDINTPGVHVLDKIGTGNDGWGISDLYTTQEGIIYYTVSNYQTDKYELRSIDEAKNMEVVTSGSGWTSGLELSPKGDALLFAINSGNGTNKTTRLVEYYLKLKAYTVFFTIEGDGDITNARYLVDGDILYTQGDSFVKLTINRLDPINRIVTVLSDKNQNAWLVDVDELGKRLLIYGWSTSSIMITDIDGNLLENYSDGVVHLSPISFSPDYQYILASELFSQEVVNGVYKSYSGAIYIDVSTKEKVKLTEPGLDALPIGYAPNDHLMFVAPASRFPRVLGYQDLATGAVVEVIDQNTFERFLGFYKNSTDRILYAGGDGSDTRYLYIINR